MKIEAIINSRYDCAPVHCITEYRPTRYTWHSSHTRTGLADDGNDIVLSEHAPQNITPQLRQ